MTKTVNINLGGTGFTIDEPAYDMLDKYLKTLAEVCGSVGDQEAALDIEQRVAEILYERYAAGGIVGIKDIEEIIVRIGDPEEIVEMECQEEQSGARAAAVTPPPLIVPAAGKRLYRDPQNRVLGGVCGGLGWYFGIDPVWLRLIFAGLCFLSLSTAVIAYIVMWIVIPKANTITQQLQMRGMASTVGNVGKFITESMLPAAPLAPQGAGKRFAATLTDILGWIGKVLFYLVVGLGFVLTSALTIGLCVAFIACFIALFVPQGSFNTNISVPQLRLLLGAILGGILVAGIPLVLAIRYFLQYYSKREMEFPKGWKIALLISWLTGLVLMISCGLLVDMDSLYFL